MTPHSVTNFIFITVLFLKYSTYLYIYFLKEELKTNKDNVKQLKHAQYSNFI